MQQPTIDQGSRISVALICGSFQEPVYLLIRSPPVPIHNGADPVSNVPQIVQRACKLVSDPACRISGGCSRELSRADR